MGYSSSFLVDEPSLISEIRQRGIEGAPHECCGLLIIREDGFELRQAENTAEDPCRSYQFQTMSLAYDLDPSDRIIVWHTHPRGTRGPSEGDLEVKVEGLNYLVVSIPDGHPEYF